ncbi:hypothetical protein AB3H90_08645 [Enterococcus sp. C63]|uniref:hypothetical protein n=1 Tax=Enterococcus sp. C63 TaxID=3231324 RepID=UPI0034A063FD
MAREMIKEQAKKYLTESNYLEFDIKIQLQEESRKMDVTLPTVILKMKRYGILLTIKYYPKMN